jgi:hypothetical protein
MLVLFEFCFNLIYRAIFLGVHYLGILWENFGEFEGILKNNILHFLFIFKIKAAQGTCHCHIFGSKKSSENMLLMGFNFNCGHFQRVFIIIRILLYSKYPVSKSKNNWQTHFKCYLENKTFFLLIFGFGLQLQISLSSSCLNSKEELVRFYCFDKFENTK